MEDMSLQNMALTGVGLLACLVFIVAFIVLIAIIWWQIFKKAGYHPAMGLLMIVPIVNIVMIFILAFARWPIYEKLSQSAVKK